MSTETETAHLAFTVDTHLLRELGALLVGRDSTALVELVKNAYDADATTVVVHGERLEDHGLISIRDDGHGMSYEDFVGKFLRIAGRSKEGGLRRSPRFARKYTGAKGIGRLSAHKLGVQLALESVPDRRVLDRSGHTLGFQATINWQQIESNTNSMDEAKEIEARPFVDESEGGGRGTLLTVSGLHSSWNTRQLNEFLAEVRSTRPDHTMYRPLPSGLFVGDLILPEIPIADTSRTDPGFSIELSGDFSGSDAQWPTLLSQVSWMLEIDAREEDRVTYRILPARATLRDHPAAEPRDYTWSRPDRGPRFMARIFIRDRSAQAGPKLPDILDRFIRQVAGIRLFYEGFRVLPYGSARNDWLGLDHASSRRTSLDYVDDIEPSRRSDIDERTYQLPNAAHFGAVFLHDETSGGLQMVVNREGFLPTPEFDQIVEIIRRGINISVRLRAQHGAVASELKKAAKRAERERRINEAINQVQGESRPPGRAEERSQRRDRFEALIDAGREAAESIRSEPTSPSTAERLSLVQAALEEARIATDDALEEQSQLRVLASLGTQVGAFVHEVNGILAQARTIRDLLDKLLQDGVLPRDAVRRVRAVRQAQNELIATLERQAVYLSDSLGAEARRRRARQSVEARWETAVRLLGSAAERRGVAIHSDVPADLRTPPMFPAEMNVVLANLLSNAIKAASDPAGRDTGKPAEVRIKGSTDSRAVEVTVENTGVAVKLDDSERWFRPFETTTSDLDAALGQGLGLGLSLTRRIVEEYGGTLAFVAPSFAMATAIRLTLPNR